MSDAPDPAPWRRRSLWPRWFPGWLMACLLTGIAFALAGGFLVKNWEWKTLAVGFAIGFGVLLVVLSLTQHRVREGDAPSGLVPPRWVRLPVGAAVVFFCAYVWAEKQLRGPAPAGLEARVAAWIFLAGLGWFGLRLLWMGWDVLRAVRAGGEQAVKISALGLILSGLAGGAIASAGLILQWPDVFSGWMQVLAWGSGLPGFFIGAIIDLYLDLRKWRLVAWLLALRLPHYRAELQSPDAGARAAAARAIMYMHRHAAPAVPDLLASLHDDVADVRAPAALAILFSDADDPTLPAALRPRLVDPDPRVRVAVAATLIRLKSLPPVEAVPILAAGLMQPEGQTSNLAAGYLAELGAEAAPALPALRAAVFDRHPPNECALDALTKLGAPGVLVLAEALSHAQSSVRRSAAYCLGTLGPTAQAAVPALQAVRDDPDALVRHAVADALARLEHAAEGGVEV